MKILFVVNDLDFFMSHRLPLAQKASESGFKIFVVSNEIPKIEYKNIIFKKFFINRSSTSIFLNLKSILELRKIIKETSPDLIHSITLKSIIISNVVLLFNKNIKKINAVTGMGYLYTSERVSIALYGLKFILKVIISMSKPYFIFQNLHDLNEFKKLGLKKNYSIIKGSGVSKEDFNYHPPMDNREINITFTGRILKDKGVLDLIKAVELLSIDLKSRIKLNLYGKIDQDNPAHINRKELKKLLIPNLIEWHGYSTEIKNKLISSDIYCFPSYREGLPKSTVEAMAIGRPIITTKAPGCEDTVENGFNGYKVEVGDVVELSEKIQKLVQNQKLRIQMGQNSRTIFLKEFTLKKVVDNTLDLYNKLLF